MSQPANDTARPNPGAQALIRHNARKSPDAGYGLWLGRAHIRDDHRSAWDAMTAKQRGYLIAAAMDDPQTRNVAAQAQQDAAAEDQTE